MNDNHEQIQAEIAALKNDIERAVKQERRSRRLHRISTICAMVSIASLAVFLVMIFTDEGPTRQDYQDRYVQLLREHTTPAMTDEKARTEAHDAATYICGRLGGKLQPSGYEWLRQQTDRAGDQRETMVDALTFAVKGWCPEHTDLVDNDRAWQ